MHPLAPISFRARRADSLKKAESPLCLLRYLVLHDGPLASNAIEAIAFARTRGGPGAPPDLELIFAPFEWRNQGLEPPQIHGFGMACVAVAPLSRGRLALRSPDPMAPPSIDFGLLSDPEGRDAAVLIAGLRLSRKIAATAPLDGEVAEELKPGPAVESDSDLRAALNEELQTVYHPTSTCRMGSDGRSVVDPKLKVRGVEGLWVVDASVMPTVPRGHPNAVVAMIANRAAGFVEASLAG